MVATLLLACAATATAPPPAISVSVPGELAPAPTILLPAIQRMVAPELGGTPVAIVTIVGPVRGWIAVAVAPPYREFPSVVLFRLTKDGSWQRIVEGLIPGVQPERSTLLDLHTQGKAFDYVVGPAATLITTTVIDKILALPTSRTLSTVVHAYFFHAHPAGPENYFVDRTNVYEFALRFFPGQYETYERGECTMFDIPPTRRIGLVASGDRVALTAETANGQTWVFSWTGVDDRGLLIGKTVGAR